MLLIIFRVRNRIDSKPGLKSLSASFNSDGEVGSDMTGVTVLGLLAGLHGRRRCHARLHQLLRELLDAVQVERVEQLEREDELLQFHLAVAPGEDPRASRDGQV